jgi:hypothetical protein
VKEIKKFNFELQNLTFTTSPNRLNEMLWEGIICQVGVPSRGCPGGSDCPVVIEQVALDDNLQSMVQMPLNCEYPEGDWCGYENPAGVFTGHDGRFCIGVVQKIWVDGINILCSGIIWKDSYPDVAYLINNCQKSLGFSLEAYPIECEIEKDENLHIYKLEFTGLCLCFSDLAAFDGTMLTKLVATRNKKQSEVDTMTPEQMQEMIDAMMVKLEASNAELVNGLKLANEDLQKQLDEVNAKLEAANSERVANEEKFEAEKLELNTKLEAAAAAIPAPTANLNDQVPAGKDKINAADELAKINKMTCSPGEKMQLRFAVWAKVSQ